MSIQKTVLGGDDVHAVVVDCGSWMVRLGCAGEDSPRSFLPCAVGVRASPPTTSVVPASTDVVMTEAGPSAPGPSSPSATSPKPPTGSDTSSARPASGLAGNLTLTSAQSLRDVNPVYTQDLDTGDAVVRSWDAMEAVWNASFNAMNLNPADSPLMIVEPTRMWADSDRASALEHAFEGLQCPAAYIGRGSAMAAFASARTTACVLDVGSQGATAVPVIDGYALQKTTKRGIVGGAFLSQRLREWAENCLAGRPDYAGEDRGVGKRMREDGGRKDEFLRAAHEFKRERVLGDDVVRKYVVTDLSSDRFAEGHREFYRLRIVDDMKAAVMQVDANKFSEQSGTKDGTAKGAHPGNTLAPKGKPKGQTHSGEGSVKSDEKEDKDAKDKEKTKDKNTASTGRSAGHVLPDGNVLSLDEYEGNEIAEHLFKTQAESNMSLTDLVFSCVSASDIDQRRDLYGGVVVTGGTTMIGGVVERLTRELAVAIPQAYKLKLHSAANAMERNSGPWIGGSIIASLGTFQQAWVSKAEYDELGASGSLRKCP